LSSSPLVARRYGTFKSVTKVAQRPEKAYQARAAGAFEDGQAAMLDGGGVLPDFPAAGPDAGGAREKADLVAVATAQPEWRSERP
jgi:hypothetical protein